MQSFRYTLLLNKICKILWHPNRMMNDDLCTVFQTYKCNNPFCAICMYLGKQISSFHLVYIIFNSIMSLILIFFYLSFFLPYFCIYLKCTHAGWRTSRVYTTKVNKQIWIWLNQIESLSAIRHFSWPFVISFILQRNQGLKNIRTQFSTHFVSVGNLDCVPRNVWPWFITFLY